MTDFLIEQLVKKNATAKDNLKKTGLFLVTALSVLLVFIIPYAVWVTMILVIVDYKIDILIMVKVLKKVVESVIIIKS